MSRRSLKIGAQRPSRLTSKWTTVDPIDEYMNLVQIPSEVSLNPSLGFIESLRLRTSGDEIIPLSYRNFNDFLPMTITLVPPNINLIGKQGILQAFSNLKSLMEARVSSSKNKTQSKEPERKRGANIPTQKPRKNVDTTQQIILNEQRMNAITPLTLFINPTDFTKGFSKKFSTEFTRSGDKTEHYGEELDSIDASGKTAGFYISGIGLTRQFRRDTAAFQNLMQLYMVYRNNGYIYEVNDPRRIAKVGSVLISYDGKTYTGSFDSFSLSESSETPYLMSYNFKFTVRRTFISQVLIPNRFVARESLDITSDVTGLAALTLGEREELRSVVGVIGDLINGGGEDVTQSFPTRTGTSATDSRTQTSPEES